MKRPIIPYCSDREFAKLTANTMMRPQMLRAVRDVVVGRMTWSKAAAGHGVTQSGMLRAMRRIARTPDPEGAVN